MYVIGGRLLVHCTEGNCSLEVPLSEVYQHTHTVIHTLLLVRIIYYVLYLVSIMTFFIEHYCILHIIRMCLQMIRNVGSYQTVHLVN